MIEKEDEISNFSVVSKKHNSLFSKLIKWLKIFFNKRDGH